MTTDIDIAVRLSPAQAARLAGAFPEPEFCVSPEAAREAATNHGQFNVIHPESGFKIDFMVAPPSPFNDGRFSRARELRPFGGVAVAFASPVDVILMKLVYFREGGSEEHLRDIDAIRHVQGETLDMRYLELWVDELGVRREWERASL